MRQRTLRRRKPDGAVTDLTFVNIFRTPLALPQRCSQNSRGEQFRERANTATGAGGPLLLRRCQVNPIYRFALVPVASTSLCVIPLFSGHSLTVADLMSR